MKVILTQDVRGKGKRGQMIEVSDSYARNFLLPKKLAQGGDRRQRQYDAYERQRLSPSGRPRSAPRRSKFPRR